MHKSSSLPTLLPESKLFSSFNHLQTTKRQFKTRFSVHQFRSSQSEQKPPRALIQFEDKNSGFKSFRNINAQKVEEILLSLKGMKSPSTHLGKSMKAEILFNKQQYGKIREYCRQRTNQETDMAITRLAKLEPLPMKKEVKQTDRNKKKIKVTTGIKTQIVWGVLENNKLNWKPFVDFDAMGVAIGHRVYFIGGRKIHPLSYYDRKEDAWGQTQTIKGLKPFGQSEGTIISSNQIMFFGGSLFYSMGQSQPINSLTLVNIETATATIKQFQEQKVSSRCFHAQCKYGVYLMISGGIDRKNKLLNNYMVYHIEKNYWVELMIASQPEKLKQGLAKHKMLPVFLQRKTYSIYADQPVTCSQAQRSLISKEGIYIFGGEDSQVQLSNKLYILQLGKASIEIIQPKVNGKLPFPRKNFDWARVGQFIFMHGGRNDQMKPWILKDLDALDLKTLTWLKVKGQRPSLRYSHTLLIYENSEIIILGGKNMEGLCKQVFPMKFQEMYEYIDK